MSRPAGFLILGAFSLMSAAAAPPGAMVRTRLNVPDALKTGAFADARYLNIPPGFQVSLFAIVPNARFMAVAPNGDILVSQPDAGGQVTLLRPVANGVPQRFTFATGLRHPHDMIFKTIAGTSYLYIAETNQIDRSLYSPGDTSAHGRQVIISGLPDSSMVNGYAHELKNFAIGGDGHLYVSIGSSCNICTGDTTASPVRGSIYQYNADGTGGRLFATGLRNAEGVRFLPGTNTLWAAVNNLDNLPYPFQDSSGNYGQVVWPYVDGHPPDLLTAVRDGGNYGWPYCMSNPDKSLDQMPFDDDYDTNRDGHVDCSKMDRATKGIQAHSAPLGLLFLQNTPFAPPYRQGAVVPLHGSWDRTRKTGYKVIYFPWNATTATPGAAIDLLTGWLDDASQNVWGKPVDAVVDSTGNLLVSDDSAGAIYRLTYSPSAVSAASGYALLAPDSIGSVFGSNLSTQKTGADSPNWPTSLGGVKLSIKDAAGATHPALMAYVSPSQINFAVPSGTATGNGSLTIENGSGTHNLGNLMIAQTAPSVFSADGNGEGVAAASAIQVAVDNSQSPVPVFTCDHAGSCKSVPIPLGVDTPVYVSFYGTGIRGRSALSDVSVTIGNVNAPVLYAGPQGVYPGLDQVNVGLPLSLRGAGEVDVVLAVKGQSANTVRIAVQ